jgi:tRNA1(Val) A37 N6-methylase TrmN6
LSKTPHPPTATLADERADFSEDRLLGGRVVLRQPRDGFRAAIDPVFLAASIPAGAGQKVLELGTGTGAAALCLARRVAGVRVTGLDVQQGLIRLAGDNVLLNGLEAEIQVMAGDILNPPLRLVPGSFDHVMANPPFMEAGSATPSAEAARALATGEGAADLAAWVRFALVMVRDRGSVTFIHRADRLGDLLALLSGPAGEIVVFPLWPGSAKPAKRVLVRARRGVATPLRLMPGLVLHQPGGPFTPAADAVLRDAAGLDLLGDS